MGKKFLGMPYLSHFRLSKIISGRGIFKRILFLGEMVLYLGEFLGKEKGGTDSAKKEFQRTMQETDAEKM